MTTSICAEQLSNLLITHCKIHESTFCIEFESLVNLVSNVCPSKHKHNVRRKITGLMHAGGPLNSSCIAQTTSLQVSILPSVLYVFDIMVDPIVWANVVTACKEQIQEKAEAVVACTDCGRDSDAVSIVSADGNIQIHRPKALSESVLNRMSTDALKRAVVVRDSTISQLETQLLRLTKKHKAELACYKPPMPGFFIPSLPNFPN